MSLRRVYPGRPKGLIRRVEECVLEAFRVRQEVVLNGINYLREEYLLYRNAVRFIETELYIRGYTKRPYWRKRGQRNERNGAARVALDLELQEDRWEMEERMWRDDE